MAGLFAVAILGPVTEARAASPNVLVIVTDDQRWEGTMVPGVMDKTLEWFRDGGVDFRNGVANTPWCCPARASIFSGRYAHNHKVENLEGTQFGTAPDSGGQLTSLQKYLNDADYHTAIFGKYLNGWGVSCGDGTTAPKPPHFDEFAIFASTDYSPTCVMSGVGDPDPPAPPGPPAVEHNISTYSTTHVKDRALDFLEEVGDSPDPWFLYLAPVTPHAPFQPEPEHEDALVPPLGEPGPSSPVFESDRSDKPDWVFSDDSRDLAWNRENWITHLRMMKSVDDMVDAVMQAIRSQGEEEETLAFFTSDNGFQWGDHGLHSKARPYMSSIRVPFYMRWKGQVAPGPRGLAAHVDIAPTVFDAMDPEPMTDEKDGVSLLAPGERKRILTEVSGGNVLAEVGGLRWSAILTSKFHYIERYGKVSSDPQAETNYDDILDREYYLAADPEELTNLLKDGDPLNNPPTAALSAALREDVECEGSESPPPGKTQCPAVDSELPLEARIVRAPTEVEYSEPFEFSDDSLLEDSSDSGSQVSRFNFTSSEPGTSFMCHLTGTPFGGGPPFLVLDWHECSSSMQYNTSTPGSYTLRLKTEDPGPPARTSPEKQHTWTVNENGLNSGPQTFIGAHPPKRSSENQAWFTFSAFPGGSSFKCKLDDGPEEYCTSPYLITDLPDAPAADPHVFQVRAQTINFDPTPATYTWSSDTTPLAIKVEGFRGPPSNPRTRDATFKFQATDQAQELPPSDAKDETDRFECSLDGAAWEPCAGLPTATRYSRLEDGVHTFQVRVVDRAGNESAAYPDPPHQWTVGDVQAYNSTLDDSWPEVTDETTGADVRAVVSDGCLGWYVGGSFNEIGNVSVSNLAHITVDPETFQKTVDMDWRPAVEATPGAGIRAMVLAKDMKTLYIGGQFTSVESQPRQRLAALKTPVAPTTVAPCEEQSTLDMVTPWDPQPSNTVHALALGASEDGDSQSIYVGGAFTTFGPSGSTVTRRKVAKLSTTGSGAVDTSWDPQFPITSTVVLALAAKPGSVYVGTNGPFDIRGPSGGTLSRDYLAEIDSKSAEGTSWNPAPSHSDLGISPSVQSLYYNSQRLEELGRLPTLFVGGAFTHIGVPQVARSGVAEINVADGGSATTWTPTTASTGTNLAVALPPAARIMNASALRAPANDHSVLYGGAGPIKLGETDPALGLTTGWNPSPAGQVFDIGVSALPPDERITKEVLAVGGLFTSPRRLLAFYCRPAFTTCPSDAPWPP